MKVRISESKLRNLVADVIKEELAGTYGISDHMDTGEQKLEEVEGYGISDHMDNGEEKLEEGVNNDPNNTHYAVNKATNKIVFSWDYSGYDSAELNQFKKDYFVVDLLDMELDPKQYTILTKASCIKRGINPDDDQCWANA